MGNFTVDVKTEHIIACFTKGAFVLNSLETHPSILPLTHPINTPYQLTLSIHSLNTRYQHTYEHIIACFTKGGS